jgi:hypothetical protein
MSVKRGRNVVCACKKTWDLTTELIGHHKFLFTFVIAMIAIQLLAAISIAPAFADTSPALVSYEVTGTTANDPIRLAQANLPSIGGIDDYMHQSGDGPSTGQSSPGYAPRGVPPPGYGPQPSAAQELNSLYSNPNGQRDLLIGAAVVGAIALGMYAYQQHELYQARRHDRRRFYGRRREYPY